MKKLLIMVLLVAFTAFTLVMGLLGSIWVASKLSAPAPREAGVAPSLLGAEDVEFISASGGRISAWYASPRRPLAAVALLHCVRCSRVDMLSRAELLWRAGYAVLLPDLQAHGESPGEAITFGHLESFDAAASIQYLGDRHPELSVGAVGMSLGGAALALGGSQIQAEAVVLESVYSTIEEAVTNRIAIRLGPLSKWLAPLLLTQLEPRLGVSAEDLRPIDQIGSLSCPVLIVSGTLDRHTTEAETRRLFQAAPEPKRLWLVEGAVHQDLLRYRPEAYSDVVVGFLQEMLVDEL